VTTGSKETLVAVGSKGSIVRSTDGGATWATVTSGTQSDLWHVTVGPKETLIAVGDGGSIVRSTDGGATWAAVASGTLSDLGHVTAGPNETLVAVGRDGSIVRIGPPYRPAPSLKLLTATYSVAGDPVLRYRVDDPSDLCAEMECLRIEGRSAPHHDIDKASWTALPVEKASIRRDAGATTMSTELVITKKDLQQLSAQRGQPLYVRFFLSGPGFNHTFPTATPDFAVPNNPDPVHKRPWFIGIAAVLLLGLTMLMLLYTKPLAILGLVVRQGMPEVVGKAGTPQGDLLLSVLRTLLLPVLVRHPRVLDAWVDHHRLALRKAFDVATGKATEKSRAYSPLPLDGPDGDVIVPSGSALRHFFSGTRIAVEIVGQGGAGKTRLAVQVGLWIFGGEMFPHPAAALFVDEEFDDLTATLRAKLAAALDTAELPPEFVTALVRRQRIVLIIDRVSERQPATRAAVETVYRKLPANALVLTARYEIPLEAQQALLLRPRALDSNTLLGFLGEQLRAAQGEELFQRLNDKAMLVQRLAQQIALGREELHITPLLVRVFVDKAVALARSQGIEGLEHLPANVPEAYFDYVEDVDAAKRNAGFARDEQAEAYRRAVTLLAFLELGDDFRPKAIPAAEVSAVLAADPIVSAQKHDYLKRLEDNGLVVRYLIGAEARVEFVLDPLAECFAAFEHARRCGSDASKWTELLQRVEALGENASGFLLALRMNHAAYAEALGFPNVDFRATPASLYP
jgi:hypothetical protein